MVSEVGWTVSDLTLAFGIVRLSPNFWSWSLEFKALLKTGMHFT